ncbi:MAG: undecaprenyl-phosphate glucose phosphotransferase [Chloroflexota bacterium]
MLRRHHEFFKSLLRLNDAVAVSLAWWLAYWLRFYTDLFIGREDYLPRHYIVAWLLILFVWGVVFQVLDLYRPRRLSTYRRELVELIKGSALALLIFLGLLFLIREVELSRIVVILFWFISLLFLNLSHTILREGLRFFRRRGYNLRHMVVVGTAEPCHRLLQKFRAYRHLGQRVAGLLLIDGSAPDTGESGIKVIKDGAELLSLVKGGGVDGVYVTLPLEQAPRLEEIQQWLADEPVDLYFVPDLGSLATMRGTVEEFDGMQIIGLQVSPLYGWNSFIKRGMDLVLGGLAFCFFLPVMALIALAVKLTSPGPVLYRQERMGLDGGRFEMLKFRTMVDDAERQTGPVWAAEDDPRATKLGRWLRLTSLDELPQLFNVLRGDMSLVGPRPERPPLIEEFRKSIPKYMLRHKVKAGMTGLAQVNGWRGNTSLDRRIEHDLDYIENWSVWGDLKILARTICGGFRSGRVKQS